MFAPTENRRYKFGTNGSDLDYSRSICTDCSTRATLVAIPTDERDAHDEWHLAD